MKKLCIGLLILLIAACAYIFNFSKKIDAVRRRPGCPGENNSGKHHRKRSRD